ncbi:hypothetical protein KC362_g61 [Hortaea werneckii]|nr:hypothetical protein KC362_g61 [Hortaea werneckii]
MAELRRRICSAVRSTRELSSLDDPGVFWERVAPVIPSPVPLTSSPPLTTTLTLCTFSPPALLIGVGGVLRICAWLRITVAVFRTLFLSRRTSIAASHTLFFHPWNFPLRSHFLQCFVNSQHGVRRTIPASDAKLPFDGLVLFLCLLVWETCHRLRLLWMLPVSIKVNVAFWVRLQPFMIVGRRRRLIDLSFHVCCVVVW